jgi:hypothetical protein
MDFLEDITPKAAAMVAIVPSLLGWWLGIHAAKPWTAFLVASLTTTAATLIGAILLVPDLATSAGSKHRPRRIDLQLTGELRRWPRVVVRHHCVGLGGKATCRQRRLLLASRDRRGVNVRLLHSSTASFCAVWLTFPTGTRLRRDRRIPPIDVGWLPTKIKSSGAGASGCRTGATGFDWVAQSDGGVSWLISWPRKKPIKQQLPTLARLLWLPSNSQP